MQYIICKNRTSVVGANLNSGPALLECFVHLLTNILHLMMASACPLEIGIYLYYMLKRLMSSYSIGITGVTFRTIKGSSCSLRHELQLLLSYWQWCKKVLGKAALKNCCGILVEELVWAWRLSVRDFSCPYSQHRFCCVASCPLRAALSTSVLVLESQNNLTSKLSYKALSCSVTVFVLDFHLSFLLNMFEDWFLISDFLP